MDLLIKPPFYADIKESDSDKAVITNNTVHIC